MDVLLPITYLMSIKIDINFGLPESRQMCRPPSQGATAGGASLKCV
jgi:hypothetical protein